MYELYTSRSAEGADGISLHAICVAQMEGMHTQLPEEVSGLSRDSRLPARMRLQAVPAAVINHGSYSRGCYKGHSVGSLNRSESPEAQT